MPYSEDAEEKFNRFLTDILFIQEGFTYQLPFDFQKFFWSMTKRVNISSRPKSMDRQRMDFENRDSSA